MYYNSKLTTWRSYFYFVISLLTTFAMFLIAPISSNAGEVAGAYVLIFIFVGCVLSILFTFVVFKTSDEKKGLASIALLLTLFNVSITLYFIWIGVSAAW